MNWIDGILIALLLASVIVGSKKGLIRELMAFIVFFAAIIISVNYIDRFAVWVHDQLGGSPLVTAFLSFAILLAGSYAVFKLCGLIFYKVAQLKNVGKRDQMGGALIGFLRGWMAIAFLTVLAFLLPMPDKFYTAFEDSFFGPAIARTIPLVYDGTAAIHPRHNSFIEQIQNTLLLSSSTGGSSSGDVSVDRAEVYRVMYQFDRFFNDETK
ncbi:MAG: CvpA family protein [Candidatus Zixiibacteriota bacterium]|nr:MAG: CvpA family protein [candidate division Zixibacteria bacterium]